MGGAVTVCSGSTATERQETSMTMISIADILPETISDGIGLRVVVFGAGCLHECKGCHNPQSWDIDNGTFVTIQEVYDRLNLANNKLLSGVTFTGGDPMYQAGAFYELAKMIRSNSKADIWCYTGYLFEEIINTQDERLDLLRLTDVLVDGRYVDSLRDLSLAFRGSSNQRIIDVQESIKRKSIVDLCETIYKKKHHLWSEENG
jgi:anaerobic ribonucleoside-triphosphate reductase activating protein